MSDDKKVVDIDALARRAQDEARKSIPADVAKLAVWRRSQTAPITFVVLESDGREAVQRWTDDGSALVEFKTYNDGGGRQSTTVMRGDEVAGMTLEVSTVTLLGG